MGPASNSRCDDVVSCVQTERCLPQETQGKRWYCAQTHPNKESYAAGNLRAQDYQYFLPTFIRTIRHARKVTRVRRALFPSYLFVNADFDDRPWSPVKNTFGVRRLIMEKDRPKPVPHGVIEALLAATNDEGCIDFRDDIEVGQDVRMMSGPFFNLVGTLARLDDRGRVAVLLDILGGERLVITDKTALQPVSP